MPERLAALIAQAGLQPTRYRLEVLAQFCRFGPTPHGWQDAYAALRQRGVPVAYSSVTRLCVSLVRAGLLQSVPSGGRQYTLRPTAPVIAAWQDVDRADPPS